MRRFLGQLARGALVSGAVIASIGMVAAASWKGPLGEGLGAAMLLIAVNAILFPVIALVALFRRRPGLLIGSFLPPLVIYIWSAALLKVDVAAMQPLLSREILPPMRAHRLVAFDNGLSGCNATCLELLARSSYDVAVRRDDGASWRVFRKVEGDGCRTVQGVAATSFIRLGFVGICAAETAQERIDDGLIVRWTTYKQGDSPAFLPPSFDGLSHALIEREAGTDRLLARWIEGRVNSRFDWMVTFFEAGPVQVAPFSKFHAFDEAALGVRFSDTYPPGTATLAARLDALEPLLLEGKAGREARELYETLAGQDYRTDAEVVRPRLRRLLGSGDAGMVETGALVVKRRPQPERIEFGPEFAALLGHQEQSIVGAGLSVLLEFPEAERAFVRQSIIDLAFSPVLRQDDGAVLGPLIKHLQSVPGPFPPELRAQALGTLLGGAELAHAERRTLLAVIAHGGARETREAVDAVFSLEGIAFEGAVAAVAGPQEKSILEGEAWTEDDLLRLLERAAEVPNDRLERYVNCFRFQRNFAVFKSRLALLIEERLEAAQAAPVRDEKEIGALRYLWSVSR